MMKKILTPVLLLLTIVSMNSCALYKEYERPDIAFVDSLYNRIPTADDYESIASLTWKELFADTLLHNLIELGLENNTDLEIARLKVEQAEATLKTSKLAFYPNVSFSAQVGANQNGSNYSLAPTASWEVDAFGRLHNTKEGAKAALAATEAYQQAVQTQLIATIADAYYTLLMLDEQLDISKRTLNTWEENIRTLSALKRAGKTNEAAVLQAKANRLSVEADVMTLERKIYEMENSFCSLIGVVPMPIYRTTLAEQVLPTELSAGVPAELLSRRPDVRQAELALAQCFYNTNAARAAFYPNLSLNGALGWTTGSGSVVLDPGSLIASFIGSLTQPIFSRGTNKARLMAARSQQEQAAYIFRQSILDAGVEVNNALVMWQTAKRRVEINRKQIVTLQAAVWNTQLLMKHGNTNYLEVLTAQKNLLSAELAEVSDRFDEIQSVINLYHALGGGYE